MNDIDKIAKQIARILYPMGGIDRNFTISDGRGIVMENLLIEFAKEIKRSTLED